MSRKFRYLTPWERFKVYKKYRYLSLYLIALVSVFLIIALYFLHISGAYDTVSKSIYNFFGISEFAFESDGYPFSVHFIDVGNGDAILVHTDKANIMIDTGEYSLNGTSAEYLQHFGIDNIDLFIASHNDSDHIGDFSHIADRCRIGKLWIGKYSVSDIANRTEDERLLYRIAADKNISIENPEMGRYHLGDMTVDVLSPERQYNNDNDNSLIVKISYKEIAVLFTGDAGKTVEEDLLAQNADLTADILKVSHHGSKTATTEEFLASVSPKYAIISVEKNNKYLPDRYAAERLYNSGAEVYRTDLNGNIIAASDGKDIYVFIEKHE